jgi:hypothetical protein
LHIDNFRPSTIGFHLEMSLIKINFINQSVLIGQFYLN